VTRDIVVVGVSAGGLDAMCRLLPGVPAQFGFALILVQHRSRESDALCKVLQTCGGHPVHEIVDKEAVERGKVYLAPADYHLLIDDGHFALSTDAPEFYSRPSIDLAFQSVADNFGARAVGLVLTGANRDGARGLRRIVERGGYALVQDPLTAEVSTMPQAALAEVPEAEVLPLQEIASRLSDLCMPPTDAKVAR
jgi:two-component system, chemotaxis family, protein-glutamate methylesterase/glutaminase